MKKEINVTMTESALFDFTLFHTYSKFAGFLTNVLGMAVIFMGIILVFTRKVEWPYIFVYVLAGIAFIGYTPWLIRRRAKKQLRSFEEFKESSHYIFQDTGIVVVQCGRESEYNWEEIQKVVATPKTIGLYYGTERALIIPKESFGDQFVPIINMIMTHVPRERMKIR
ncbi:YcxB family protein [Lachnospiraceae bacterium LCP25S3_G4]